jgi:predicted Zn-dependent protease
MRSGSPSSPTLLSITDHWIQKQPPPMRPGSDQPAHLVSWPELVGDPATGADLAAVEALAYASAGQRTEAERRVASVAASGVHVPRLYDWLAGYYKSAGQPWNAAGAYAAILRFDPDAGDALRGYARLMLDGGPPGMAEATHALDRMLAIDPDDPGALETKATLLFRSGQVDEARPLFARAATIGPSSGASHVALAVFARREGRDADAISELEAARRIAPSDAWILDRLRDAYSKAGDAAHAEGIARARTYFSAREGAGQTDATRWLPDSWR